MREKIILNSGSAPAREVELVSFFSVANTGKRYLFFTQNEVLDDNLTKLYISEVVVEANVARILNVVDETDWNQVKEVMRSILTSSNAVSINYLEGLNLEFSEVGFRALAMKSEQVTQIADAYYQSNPKEKLVLDTSSAISNQAPVLENGLDNITPNLTPAEPIGPSVDAPVVTEPATVIDASVANVSAPQEIVSPTLEPVQVSEIEANPITDIPQNEPIANIPGTEVQTMDVPTVAPQIDNITPTDNLMPVDVPFGPPPVTEVSAPVDIPVDIPVDVPQSETITAIEEKIVGVVRAAVIVEQGETIVSIADKWGVSPADVISANSLALGAAIIPGMVLLLPDTEAVSIADLTHWNYYNKKINKMISDSQAIVKSQSGVKELNGLMGLNDVNNISTIQY